MTSSQSVPKRESLWAIHSRYIDGSDKATLQTLMKAFKGIQKLPPDDPNSFFCISGFHGLPFRGPGVTDSKWWGGYCHHGDTLFPFWHRVYVLRLENALRTVAGCENVRLPYWDEIIGYDPSPRRQFIPGPIPAARTVPAILTSREFEGEPNPLYSYKLQEKYTYKVEGDDGRYTKDAGYETVRYPLSGLVGTKKDRNETAVHNDKYRDGATNARILNENVRSWLQGYVDIPDDDPKNPTGGPSDVTSVYERILKCLKAPNYTVFSNTESQSHYNSSDPPPKEIAVSLESPHNSIHLAVGGFYQKWNKNADPAPGVNGDMGSNETAAFDPIFWFHHCFIDYVFWKWQELHDSTTKLEIDPKYKGTKTGAGLPVPEGAPPMPIHTPLTLETPLYPFLKDDPSTYFKSKDVIDIKKLGYDYAHGPLDTIIGNQSRGVPFSFGFSHDEVSVILKISGINSADYEGSYVVRLYGYIKGKRVELGREAVLSRLQLSDCPNCESHLEKDFFIPLHKDLTDRGILEKEGDNYRTSVGIKTAYKPELFPEGDKAPKVTQYT